MISPSDMTFEVRDLNEAVRNGQVVDYSEGEVVAHERGVSEGIVDVIYTVLQNRTESAERVMNKAFSPPYLVMKVTHSGRRFISAAGPCHAMP